MMRAWLDLHRAARRDWDQAEAEAAALGGLDDKIAELRPAPRSDWREIDRRTTELKAVIKRQKIITDDRERRIREAMQPGRDWYTVASGWHVLSWRQKCYLNFLFWIKRIAERVARWIR